MRVRGTDRIAPMKYLHDWRMEFDPGKPTTIRWLDTNGEGSAVVPGWVIEKIMELAGGNVVLGAGIGALIEHASRNTRGVKARKASRKVDTK